MREQRSLPATLTLEQVSAIVAGQRRLRDRFFFSLLALTGMRVGQALGLRHSDLVGHERRIEIVARDDNRFCSGACARWRAARGAATHARNGPARGTCA